MTKTEKFQRVIVQGLAIYGGYMVLDMLAGFAKGLFIVWVCSTHGGC